MTSSNLSALIVLTVTATLLAMMGMAFAASGVPAGLVVLVTLMVWIVYVGMTSFYKIPADKMLASFLFGTLKNKYVNGTFAKAKKRLDGGTVTMTHENIGGELGLFNLDIVILLYPFWHGVYFPTTVVKLIIHATTVYLKEEKETVKSAEGKTEEIIKSPSVPVRVDVTILFRLTPDLGSFVQTINVLGRGIYDLAHEAEICDNLWNPNDENNGRYVYRSPRIAQLVLNAVSETVLHSVRSVASQSYTWKQVATDVEEVEGGVCDIKGSIPRFRGEVLVDLAESQSVFCQSGMLKPCEKSKDAEEEPEDTKVSLGPAVLSFDLRVEDVTPEDEEFAKALSRPMIADLEADADKLRGGGEGERLKRKSEVTGISTDELYRGEVVQGVDEVRVYGAGDTVTDLIKKFLGGKE